MNGDPTPPQALLAARRALETVKGYRLLQDWTWHAPRERWVLQCRLSVAVSPGSRVTPDTDWYVHAAPSYPWGSIECYPAKVGGLTGTFPHQEYNAPGEPSIPWREGYLCLSTPARALGRHGYDREPYGVHERLRWHVRRALDWLVAASQDQLLRAGEPFELPKFPGTVRRGPTVVFQEEAATFTAWEASEEFCGIADLALLRSEPPVYIVRAFRSARTQLLLDLPWGDAIPRVADPPVRAVWVRLTAVPILEPWQAPATWGELRGAGMGGNNLDHLLRMCFRRIRDAHPHVLLLGFPIPTVVGESPRQLHWQALQLPVLSSGTVTANGFRTNELGYWQRDRRELLTRSTRLEWLRTENWHADELSTRGRFPEHFISKRVLLLGAGALGSAVAELLVRAGIRHLTILDGEMLEAGNLVRHTLTLDDLKTNKAEALARRLNHVFPYGTMHAIGSHFPPKEPHDVQMVQGSDVVLDCTGQDEVLFHLSSFPWPAPTVFASLSLGFGGKRLYCFAATGSQFPLEDFRRAIDPWLRRELLEQEGRPLPWEGTGCWHPVFPVRADDVWLMASAAVHQLDALCATQITASQLAVFEQQHTDGLFTGISRVFPQASHAG